MTENNSEELNIAIIIPKRDDPLKLEVHAEIFNNQSIQDEAWNIGQIKALLTYTQQQCEICRQKKQTLENEKTKIDYLIGKLNQDILALSTIYNQCFDILRRHENNE